MLSLKTKHVNHSYTQLRTSIKPILIGLSVKYEMGWQNTNYSN